MPWLKRTTAQQTARSARLVAVMVVAGALVALGAGLVRSDATSPGATGVQAGMATVAATAVQARPALDDVPMTPAAPDVPAAAAVLTAPVAAAAPAQALPVQVSLPRDAAPALTAIAPASGERAAAVSVRLSVPPSAYAEAPTVAVPVSEPGLLSRPDGHAVRLALPAAGADAVVTPTAPAGDLLVDAASGLAVRHSVPGSGTTAAAGAIVPAGGLASAPGGNTVRMTLPISAATAAGS